MKIKLLISSLFSVAFAGLIFAQAGMVNATTNSNQPISSPISSSENPWTGRISVATWVKLNSYSGSYPRIISKLGSFELIMYTFNNQEGLNQGRLEWDVRLPLETDTVTSSANKIPLNTWTHVAAVYDGSVSKIYINGVKVSEKIAAGSIIKSNWPTALGEQSNGTRPLDASFANPVATTSAFTQSDINALYQSYP